MTLMNQKVLRYATLAPILLSLLSFLRPFVPSNSFVTQFFISSSNIFGVSVMCVIWFIYFSGYRYGKHIMLGQGIISLIGTIWILVAHYLRIDQSLERLLVPAHSVFLFNLTYIFMAGYIIQILYFWLPRTKVLINFFLGVILFVSLLSIFGHIYTFHGISQEALLVPTPFGDLLSYFLLILVIFVHTNRMEHLYLDSKIMFSFAIMFIAVIGANIVVYENLSKTVQTSSTIEATHKVLTETYGVDFYLGSAQSSAQAFETSGDTKYFTQYQNSKQQYLKAIRILEQQSSQGTTADTYTPVLIVSKLGNRILSLVGNTVSQKQSMSATLHTSTDAQINDDMSQILSEIETINLTYTDQLNRLTTQESVGSRGIILGVSITSALSLLLIIFTPLFIRQTIQKLAATQSSLKTSNKLLSKEKSRAEAILSGIGDGIFVVDNDHTLTVFNKAAETITGMKAIDVVGQKYQLVMQNIAEESGGSAEDFIAKALAGVGSHVSDYAAIVHKTGRKMDLEITTSPIKENNGDVAGAISVFSDRTSERALENAKDEFVSLASHQLRTPATVTKQFLAMFLQGYAGQITDKQRLFLQQAYDNNELGINIIEDLLNITRLESNRFKVANEKIELGDFLRKSIEQHEIFATRGKQTLRLKAPTNHIYVDADPSLVGMAVDNLITNALKYSDEGDTVIVRLSSGDRAAIAVIDEGIGIKKEDLPKLFERFTRLEDPQKQYVSGTGIGLYLLKKISKKMHATIHVESDYGKGSTFTIEFKPYK
jgi:PAS domain S-box-containing protein